MSRYCCFYVTVALWIYDSAEFLGCYMSSVIGKCSVMCILLYFSTNCVWGRRTLTLQVPWLIPRVSYGLGAILDQLVHLTSTHVCSFSRPGTENIVTLFYHEMKHWQVCVHYMFVYPFSHSFQFSFVCRKSSTLR